MIFKRMERIVLVLHDVTPIILFQGDDYFSRVDTVHWMSEYKNEKSVSIKEKKKGPKQREAD